jgi:hypothetical protein
MTPICKVSIRLIYSLCIHLCIIEQPQVTVHPSGLMAITNISAMADTLEEETSACMHQLQGELVGRHDSIANERTRGATDSFANMASRTGYAFIC